MSDFVTKTMLLNLTFCFILTFSQWNLINLGAEVHLRMPKIIQI